MKNQSKKKTDRRKLGWLAAGMLALVLSSPAWALDLDQEIARQEVTTVQIQETIGQRIAANTSNDTHSQVNLTLIKRHKHKKVKTASRGKLTRKKKRIKKYA